jgi:hypothetical protein
MGQRKWFSVEATGMVPIMLPTMVAISGAPASFALYNLEL